MSYEYIVIRISLSYKGWVVNKKANGLENVWSGWEVGKALKIRLLEGEGGGCVCC